VTVKDSEYTMSLVNLVQLICLEKQSAALILSKEQSQEGVIYFNQGEIIEAKAGTLCGEDAIYEILTWTDGKFRLSSDVLLPRRTIMTPWDHILSEGRRRIDELRIEDKEVSGQDEDLTSNEVEQDSALELDLIYLLSKLEHSRALLTEGSELDQPPMPLLIFSNIVKNIVDMSKKHLPGNSFEEALSAARADSSGIDLGQVVKGLMSDELLDKGKDWEFDADTIRNTYLRLGSSIVAVLDRFFGLITERFRSSSVTERWKDTCATFMDELRQAIESYQC
jgi:hypothetical protein